MRRHQLVALLAVVALAGFVIVLAVRNRPAHRLPPDSDHAQFVSPRACLSCHGPAGVLPQSQNHPPRTDCMACHGHR